MPVFEVGTVHGTFEEHTRVPVDITQWCDVYTDVMLSTGQRVDQVTVCYDLTRRHQDAAIEVHFETMDGDRDEFTVEQIIDLRDGN